MKTNYLQLLSYRDQFFMLDEIYFDVLNGKEDEVDKLIYERKVTQNYLESTQMALQE